MYKRLVMEEKTEDGISANSESSRGAYIPYISFCASMGSKTVV